MGAVTLNQIMSDLLANIKQMFLQLSNKESSKKEDTWNVKKRTFSGK